LASLDSLSKEMHKNKEERKAKNKIEDSREKRNEL